MNCVFRGRVIDVWKGNNPKYPDTSVTFTDVKEKGQVKLSIPDTVASAIVMDGLYDLNVTVRVSNNKVMGQVLHMEAGDVKRVKGE